MEMVGPGFLEVHRICWTDLARVELGATEAIVVGTHLEWSWMLYLASMIRYGR